MIHKQKHSELLARSAVVVADGRAFPVDVARHPRARRYVLRVTPRGTVRLTVPRRLSLRGGVAFAEGQAAWIAREWRRIEQTLRPWASGTEIWFRGERVPLHVDVQRVAWGGEIASADPGEPVRAVVERHLRALATRDLSARCRLLAREHGTDVTAISIRNQRSRWGSCSRRRTITLNWRLLQMPPEVSDYVILHELAHVAHPNHSTRFWRAVAVLCPWWRDAERWLRKHGKELLS